MKSELNNLKGAVRFENQTFTPAEIKQIADSTKLVGLSFVNCPITDADIKVLSTLPKLVNLSLEQAKITDKSLEYLSSLPRLNYLFIIEAAITGSGFQYFADNNKIACIWACQTQLNDENIQYLGKLKKLGTLVFHDTLVSFDGLLRIAYNPRLTVVSNNFTEEQIAHFESEQRNLAKKDIPLNEQDMALAKGQLLAFFTAINAWERHALEPEVYALGFTDDLQNRCKAIFKEYCTDKPRSGYRPEGLYMSDGPDYSYGDHRIIDSEQVTKRKIYFYTQDSNSFQYRYTMVNKDNVWKVDEGHRQSAGWKKQGL